MNSKSVQSSTSLRYRLAVTLLGAVTVLTIVLYFAIRHYAIQVAQQSQDRILNASITSMLDAASIRNGALVMDIPYATFSMLNTDSDDRVFYVIQQDGEVLSGYQDLSIPALDNESTTSFQSGEFMNVSVRQVTASRLLVGTGLRTEITASIAQTKDSLAGTLRDISQQVALLGAGFFTVAVLLSVWAASITFSPLGRLATSMARRGPHDLSPVRKPVPLEMVPLVSSLNSFMLRLETSLRQSEDFITEAAHRIRTPIATIRSHAETTLLRVDKDENRQSLRAMIRAIDETSRAASQLLDHAMISFRTSQLGFSQIDLVELARDSVVRLTPIADMKDINLQLQGEESVPCRGDPILIHNAVYNLVDNALKYSPAESTITVKVLSQPGHQISVQDQGPGFVDDEIASLTDRFTRGSNAAETIGSGLGLTIAKDVALAHGGTLLVRNQAHGGACVTLSL